MMSSVQRVISAALDLGLAGAFLATWITPTILGEGRVAYLMLLMMLEFFIVHSSGFTGHLLLDDTLTRRKRVLSLMGYGAFYSFMALGLALPFRSWWPVWTIGLLTLNRVAGVLMRAAPTESTRSQMRRDWAASVSYYTVFAVATAFVPVPRLGLTRAAVAAQDLPGSGLWVDEPQRIIAFGFLYFASMGISGLFRHSYITVPSGRAKSRKGEDQS